MKLRVFGSFRMVSKVADSLSAVRAELRQDKADLGFRVQHVGFGHFPEGTSLQRPQLHKTDLEIKAQSLKGPSVNPSR